MKSEKSILLAIEGGTPAVSQPLPPMYPGGMWIDEEEEAAVLEVIRTRRLFRYYGPQPGPSKVAELEEVFAKFMGVQYGLAVTSGTAALICSLAGLGIGPGDEVIVPAYTWIASASAVVAVGAVPIMAEVDDSLTIDPNDLEHKITPFTRAVIPVHMRGAPCRMDAILDIARKHNLLVLEDTAQADGASYQGKHLGSFGDAGAFSLQFNKIITSGEGGMMVTDRKEVYDRAVMYHDVIGGMRNQIPQEQILPGINFRMPELLGAVSLVQLRRLNALLDAMRARKYMIKENISRLAAQKGIQFRKIHDPKGDAAVALVFFLPETDLARRVAMALAAEGIPASTMYAPDRVDYHIYAHWSPIMNQRAWTSGAGPWVNHPRRITYHHDMCPKTLDLLSRAVHLDISPDFTNNQIEEITEGLNKVFNSL